MKKKKWLVCLLSLACLIASAFAFASCGDSDSSGARSLTFEKIEGKEEFAVVGVENKEIIEVKIPSTHNDLPVTTIGVMAFSDCNSLTSIVIPDSVTTIGSYAFYYCTSLTSIVIPDSITSIGYGAFYSCDSLTSIVIPDSVTLIGYGAFNECAKLTIYCEAESKPSGWNIDWNYSNRPVEWGYKG